MCDPFDVGSSKSPGRGDYLGSTSLKMRVELRVGDVAYESCDVDSVPQAKAWVRAKTIEWHLHSPRLVPEFIVV